MKLCSRCRQRRDGADVRLSHQTEASWLCWSCLKTVANNHDRDDRPFGPCCFDNVKPAEPGRSMGIACNCPYRNGRNVCGGRHDLGSTESYAVGRTVSIGESRTYTESVSRSFARGSTVRSSEEGFTDGDGI